MIRNQSHFAQPFTNGRMKNLLSPKALRALALLDDEATAERRPPPVTDPSVVCREGRHTPTKCRRENALVTERWKEVTCEHCLDARGR